MLVADAIARIDLTLGTSGGGAHGLVTVLNEAGQHVFASRSWAFARKMRGTATLVAGSTYLRLPLGCAAVVAIERLPVWSGSIALVDAGTFQAIRALDRGDASDLTFYAAEDYEACDGQMRLRLVLDHAPSATVVRAVGIAYEAEWQHVTGSYDGTEVLPLPAFVEPYFLAVLDAYALGLERPHSGTVSERMALVDAGPLRASAVDRDERAVIGFGPSRHTAVQVARRALGGEHIHETSTIHLTP